jgi:hypothetical protein
MRWRPCDVFWLGVLASWALAACGSPDEAPAPPPPKPSGVVFDVDSRQNLCPLFTYYSITPTSIPPLTIADIEAFVLDPDGGDPELEWKATSGWFSALHVADTRYLCDAVGPQTLKLSATDSAGCERHVKLEVTCLEE